MADKAKKDDPSGKVSKLAGEAIPMHKQMAMGVMPKVDGKKIPA